MSASVTVVSVSCCFGAFQIDDYSLVRFLPLDVSDEESIDNVLLQIDAALQYGEDQEPKEPRVRSVNVAPRSYSPGGSSDVQLHVLAGGLTPKSPLPLRVQGLPPNTVCH